jgi:hypothetical protein
MEDAEEARDEEAIESRDTYKGGVAPLLLVLEEHARRDGKSFIRYPTPETIDKATLKTMRATLRQSVLDVKKMTKHKPLLRSLHALHPNLSFSQKVTKLALKELVAKLGKDWGMNKQSTAEYITEFDMRIRCMCFQARKALERSVPPLWAEQIFGSDAELHSSWASSRVSLTPAKTNRKAADLESPAQEEAEYTYGWHRELRLGTRRCIATGREELALPTASPPLDADGHDPVRITFADGTAHNLDCMTIAQLRRALGRQLFSSIILKRIKIKKECRT